MSELSDTVDPQTEKVQSDQDKNKTPLEVEASGAAGPSKKTDTMPKEPPKKKAKTKMVKEKDTCVETCQEGPKSGCPIRGKGKPARGWNLSCREVDRRIEALGRNPKYASICVKSAIQKGFIKITGEDKEELNQVVLSGAGDWHCGHTINATLGDLLEQPDYAGTDYEDGSLEATVVCKACEEDPEIGEFEEGRTYVTNICTGRPQFDCGKFHNHCTACPGFGMCINDYR